MRRQALWSRMILGAATCAVAAAAAAPALAAPGDDPPPPVVSIADAPAVTEGGPGVATGATFTVTLSYAPGGPVFVRYATADGTATAGDDYTAVSGTLKIPAGQTTATITVPVIGDDAAEPDEGFSLTIDFPDGADLGRATATGTIVDDDSTPPPPPPPPVEQPKAPVQADHALLGTVRYRPSFAPGADSGGPVNLLASPFAKTALTVYLYGADGHLVRSADVARPDPRVLDFGLVDFEMDNLPACSRCTVILGDPPGAAVGDQLGVSFGGEPGQTVVGLEAGHNGAGGAVEGVVESPMTASPVGFVVRVVRGTGKIAVLADSTKATLQCSLRGTAGPRGTALVSGVGCPAGSSFTYRLTGLPQDRSTATVQLLQKTPTGDPIVVDTQDVVLGAGDNEVPTLEALDTVPRHAVGRTLYGRIATLAPYPPGVVTTGELVPDPKDRPTVALTREDKTIKKATVYASTGRPTGTGLAAPAGLAYSFESLDACTSHCALELTLGKSTRSFPVVAPARSPSVTRADLRYPATGTSEFLEGEVTTLGRANVRVRATDAKSGKVLADSATLPDPTCRTSARCGAKASVPVTGTAGYRLGGLPAGRAVKVTLSVAGKDADTTTVTTAPAGQVTVADTLVAPILTGRGRSIVGTVVSARGFVAGLSAPRIEAKSLQGVRLVDAGGKVLATALLLSTGNSSSGVQATSATTYAYQLSALPPCDACTVELVERTGAVSDRAPVTVREDPLSVTAVPTLGDGELTGGKWVNVAVDPSAKVTARDLRVTITAGGKVIADSGAARRCVTSTSCPASAGGFFYRFGAIPADAGTVTVTVTLRGKKAAGDTVRFDPGAIEAGTSLVVRVPSTTTKS
jgi:hypothetical protein